MKNILITGGTGFVGSHLVKTLLKKKKYNIRLFIRAESNLKRIKNLKNISLFKGNFYDPSDIAKSLEGIDTFFHLAAILGRGRKEDYQRFNIEVSKRFFNFALKKKVKKVVYLSSLAVMGGTEKPHIYTEEDTPTPKTLYAKSKYEVERYALHLANTYGLNITIIRAPAVYGPEDNFDRGFIRIIDLIAKKKFVPIGTLNNLMSLVYIDNLIDALITVAKSKKSNGKIYFVSDKEILTTGESYDIICNLLGVEKSRFTLPVWFISKVEAVIEFFAKIFGFLPWYPENYVNDITSNYACSIKKIQQELNWRPRITTYEGLRRTIEWYKNKKFC